MYRCRGTATSKDSWVAFPPECFLVWSTTAVRGEYFFAFLLVHFFLLFCFFFLCVPCGPRYHSEPCAGAGGEAGTNPKGDNRARGPAPPEDGAGKGEDGDRGADPRGAKEPRPPPRAGTTANSSLCGWLVSVTLTFVSLEIFAPPLTAESALLNTDILIYLLYMHA